MKNIIKATTILIIFIFLFLSMAPKVYSINMNLDNNEYTNNYSSENVISTSQSNTPVTNKSNSNNNDILNVENILSIIIIVIGIILIFLGIAIIIRCK